MLGMILLVIGFSYAFFIYNKTGLYTHTITGGKMKVIYEELAGNNIVIENSYPRTDEEALTYGLEFVFTVSGYNESEKHVYYAIEMDYAEDMSYMFNGMTLLESLDLSSFDTSTVTNMYSMFGYMYSIKVLDLSNFNMTNVSNLGWMFESCSNLTTIYCNDDWNIGNKTATGMFNGCYKLVDAIEYNHGGIQYANPDTGYFTKKNV